MLKKFCVFCAGGFSLVCLFGCTNVVDNIPYDDSEFDQFLNFAMDEALP